MKSHEVLRMVLKQFGFKRAAAELKLAPAYLYNWCNPDGGKANGSLNPLERLLSVMRLTGDLRPLHWLCEQCGGFFVKNPPASPSPAALNAAENQVIHAQSEFAACVTAAAGKGGITAAEAAELRVRWEQVKSATEGFVQACERGSFRCGAMFLALGSLVIPDSAPALVPA
jgi:hypothetical protein